MITDNQKPPIEDMLTLSEKPRYIDDLNNNLMKRNSVES